ncbi:ABC transporter permease [Bdellovibrionota bacterium FG-2]
MIRRFLISAVSFLTLLLIIFAASRAIVRALPGDPLETLIAESGSSIAPEDLRIQMGLDRPFFQALVFDLKNAVQGNLGVSLLNREPIALLLASRFVKTLKLACLALILSLTASLTLGLFAASGHSLIARIADRICTYYGALSAAMPTPWLGPILLLVFCVWIPIFPSSNHIVLPALTLAFSTAGFWARLIRQRVRETLAEGSAPGARARGVPEWKVILKYGLAPASGSMIAYLGTQFGAMLGGAFITEIIFDWRGMGMLFVEAVLKRDYPVVEAATFTTAALILCGTTLGDFLRTFMDPRSQQERSL